MIYPLGPAFANDRLQLDDAVARLDFCGIVRPGSTIRGSNVPRGFQLYHDGCVAECHNFPPAAPSYRLLCLDIAFYCMWTLSSRSVSPTCTTPPARSLPYLPPHPPLLLLHCRLQDICQVEAAGVFIVVCSAQDSVLEPGVLFVYLEECCWLGCQFSLRFGCSLP